MNQLNQLNQIFSFINSKPIFDKSIKILKIACPIMNNNVFDYITDYKHDSAESPASLIGRFGVSQNYHGYQACGFMSYILSSFIQKQFPNLVLEVGLTSIGYGRYLNDHMFIKTKINDQKIIIDPTFKQFFLHHQKNSEYIKYLFSDLKPFFVGTYDDLEEIVDEAIKLNNDLNKKEILRWWSDNSESPIHLDVLNCISQKELLEKKSQNIQGLIKIIEKELN